MSNTIEYLLKDLKRIEKMIYAINKQRKELIYIHAVQDNQNIRILYKEKYKEEYYLIIYQTNININFSYELLNLCINIFNVLKSKRINIQKIVPIAICWQKHNFYKYKELKNYYQITTFDNNIINFKYNILELKSMINRQVIKNTVLEDIMFLIQ